MRDVDNKLLESSKLGRYDDVLRLLLEGANVNVKDKFGWTPLHYAVRSGIIETVRLLLDHGADINAQNDEGNTPLHEAAWFGMLNIVKLLLDRGAKVDIRNKNGGTPLHYAVTSERVSIVEALLDHGANINARDNYGRTPIYYAIMIGSSDIVKLLLDRGADVNVRDNHGCTPLHIAVKGGRTDIVKLLLDHGAKSDVWCEDGRPIDLAKKYGYKDIINILSKYTSSDTLFEIVSAYYTNYVARIHFRFNMAPISLEKVKLLFGEILYDDVPYSVNEVESISISPHELLVPGEEVETEFYLYDSSPPYNEPATVVVFFRKHDDEETKYSIIQNVVIKGLTKKRWLNR